MTLPSTIAEKTDKSGREAMSVDILNELTIQTQRLTKNEKLILASRLIEQAINTKSSDMDNEEETEPVVEDKYFRREYKWIAEHQDEFAGQYVALDGDQLISHGANGRQVLAEARKQGVKQPFIARVDSPDDLPFGGW
jgi:hypothetical protein